MQTVSPEPFLVRFMKIGYVADFYLYPAVSLILAIASFVFFKLAIWQVLALYIGGYCIWGLMEYFMHRYTFHHAPIFKSGHDEHHKRPRLHIGTPFFVTLPIYFLVSWLIALSLGYGITAALLGGFIAGYYSYLICHHVVHNRRIKPGDFWYRYKKFHDIHHYQQTVNFGVSWLIWDRVFGTYQAEAQPRQSNK